MFIARARAQNQRKAGKHQAQGAGSGKSGVKLSTSALIERPGNNGRSAQGETKPTRRETGIPSPVRTSAKRPRRALSILDGPWAILRSPDGRCQERGLHESRRVLGQHSTRPTEWPLLCTARKAWCALSSQGHLNKCLSCQAYGCAKGSFSTAPAALLDHSLGILIGIVHRQHQGT